MSKPKLTPDAYDDPNHLFDMGLRELELYEQFQREHCLKYGALKRAWAKHYRPEPTTVRLRVVK
jgi:hypothetical protein